MSSPRTRSGSPVGRRWAALLVALAVALATVASGVTTDRSLAADPSASLLADGAPEPAAEPDPTAEPEPTQEPDPTAEPEPTQEPDPTAEPEPTRTPKPTRQPEPEPTAQPEPDPPPTDAPGPTDQPPTPMPSATAEPGPGESDAPTPEPTAEPDDTPEPDVSPSASPEPPDTNTADILEPPDEAFLKGQVTITGTVSGSGPAYALDYRVGCDTDGTPIVVAVGEGGAPIEAGTLAGWDTTVLPDGRYLLTLTVTTAGAEPVADAICVTVDNTAPAGSLTGAPRSDAGPVLGTATDANLLAYAVEYAPGPDATDGWLPVDASTPVMDVPVTDEGALANWDTAAARQGPLDGLHSVRLTISDRAGNQTVVTRVVYLANAASGEASPVKRFAIPVDWSLTIDRDTGAVGLRRELFRIPSYGPAQSLTLRYSSDERAESDRFGMGWTSDLTQHLGVYDGLVVWYTARHGVVPFDQIDGSWAAVLPVSPTLTHDADAATFTLDQGDGTLLVFEDVAPGRLLRIADVRGQALTLGWTDTAVAATDDSGRSSTLELDLDGGHVASVTDSAGRSWRFAYDGELLASVTDPADAVSRFAYEDGRLVRIDTARTLDGGPQRVSWRIAYGADGSTLTDPGGEPAVPAGSDRYVPPDVDITGLSSSDATTTAPAPGSDEIVSDTKRGEAATVTSADGTVTRYEYDRDGNRTATVQAWDAGADPDADSNVRTEYRFAEDTVAGRAGLVTSVVGPTGDVTRYRYDAMGRVVAVISVGAIGPDGTEVDLVSRIVYDELGLVAATVDPRGIVTRWVTDPTGHVTRRIVNCTDGGSQVSADPAACSGGGTHDADTNVITDYAYDVAGDLASETLRMEGQDRRTEWTHDDDGHVVRVVADPDGLAITTQTAWDGEGRKSAERDARGAVTRWFRDEAGDVVRVVVDCTDRGTDPPDDWRACTGDGRADGTWNLTTRYAYDERHRVTSVTTPTGHVTTLAYDGDRLVRRTEHDVPVGSALTDLVTTYAYGDGGRTVSVRAPTVDDGTFVVTTERRDRLGRLVERIEGCTDDGDSVPADGVVCLGRGLVDADTNVASTWGYDAAGRLVWIRQPDPANDVDGTSTIMTRYAYDGAGRQCLVIEVASETRDGRTACASGPAADDQERITRLRLDAAGDVVASIGPDGRQITVRYDALGRPVARVDADGTRSTWRYDAAGDVIRTRRDSADSPVDIAWTYDAAGRAIVRVADDARTRYGYDEAGSLISARGPDGAIAITRDAMGRVIEVDPTDGPSTTYRYDLDRVRRTDPSGDATFGLDQFGRVVQAATPLGDVPITDSYRADGAPLTAGTAALTTTYTHDALGRLTGTVTSDPAGTELARYDVTYGRAGVVLTEASSILDDPASGTATYRYDHAGTLREYDSPLGAGYGPTARAVREDAGTDELAPRPATCPDAPARQTFGCDGLGRLVSIRDADTGDVIATYTYDALDRAERVTRGGATVRFRYVGASDQVAQTIDEDGVTRYVHDLDGRPLGEVRPDGSVGVYGISPAGDVTWVSDAAGAATATLRYDPTGTVIAASGIALPDLRARGAWYDTATGLYRIAGTWHAPPTGPLPEPSRGLPPRDAGPPGPDPLAPGTSLPSGSPPVHLDSIHPGGTPR